MSNIFERLGIDISPKNKVARTFFKSLITEYNKNIKKFESSEVNDYFNNLVAAFMLEYHKSYENFDIKVPYRIKSPKSVLDKVLDYLSRNDKHKEIDKDNENYKLELNEEIRDMFAMTVVSGNTPPTFASNDPEIMTLISEKKTNDLFLEVMQKYKLQITKNEFSGIENHQYQYTSTKREYYYYSIMEIERIKSLLDPRAVNLIEKYDDMLNRIKQKVPKSFYNRCMRLANECKNARNIEDIDSTKKLMSLNSRFLDEVTRYLTEDERKDLDSPISKSDTEVVDFFSITKDFSARLYDKLDLAVLQKQVYSVFESSELLKRFGIKLDISSEKEKRTPSGYVANFVYIDTPFGKIEMQLQTQHENIEGNYGYAAHTEMNGKKLKEIELPEPGDKEKLREFQECVNFVSPKKFLAQFDNTERNRVIIQKSGKYQNYKSVISQVKRGSKEDERLTKYFAKLYPRRNEFFPNPEDQDKVESFIGYDIEQYLDSPEYKKLMQSAIKQDKDDDVR